MSSGLSTIYQLAVEGSDAVNNFDFPYRAFNCPYACIIAWSLTAFSAVLAKRFQIPSVMGNR